MNGINEIKSCVSPGFIVRSFYALEPAAAPQRAEPEPEPEANEPRTGTRTRCATAGTNNSPPDEDQDTKMPKEPLEAQLFDYMCDHQITHSSMRTLLGILNSHAELPLQKLPKDPKTLMRRYKPTRNLIMKETKEFAYIGVRNSLILLYETKNNAFDNGAATIKLAFNVDGLPTSKSSSAEVWPILMSTDIARDYVQVIAVYYGAKKPSANVLLVDFITELGPLLENGIQIQDGSTVIQKRLVLDYVVCDLPALALVKGITGHSGYASCPKCTVFGVNVHSRITFIPERHNDMASQGYVPPKKKAKKKVQEKAPEEDTPDAPVEEDAPDAVEEDAPEKKMLQMPQ